MSATLPTGAAGDGQALVPDRQALVPDLVSRVVAYTSQRLALEREDWQKAVFLNGLRLHPRPEHDDVAGALVDRAVATQTSAGELSYGPMDRRFQMRQRGVAASTPGWWTQMSDDRFLSQTNTAALGVAVLDRYERTRDARYLDAATRQLERLLAGNRTSDGAITQYRGVPYLFVDAVYMMCPFLVRMGVVTQSTELQAKALRQLELHAQHLRDPRTGLFRHVWCEQPDHFPQSTFWARGNGWVVAAAADVLRLDGVDEAVRLGFADRARALAETLVDLQDRSGFWHNIVDDDTAWLETSGTALLTYGMASGMRDGWLDERFRGPVERARTALGGAVDRDGAVLGVAGVPGGPEVLPEVNPTGQGSWLMAMADGR